MKTSIIFLTLLFAVSCKIDSSENAAFIQLSKDPRAEAVLATVAIQMQQNNGFEKVQSLLNDLLREARENLHHNNVLNARAQGRCDIYNHKLSEKNEYLNSLVDSLNSEKITVEDATVRAGDAITSRTELITVYGNMKTSELARFQNEQSFYNSVSSTVQDARVAVEELLANLRLTDQPASASFLQTKIKRVTDAYQKVFNINIDIPTAFIQMSIDNNAAKQRIVSWLDDINMTFSSMISEIADDAAQRQSNSENFAGVVDQVNEALAIENGNISNLKDKYESLTESYNKNINDFTALKESNSASLEENTNFCNNEENNYMRVKKSSEENVQVYEELLDFFLENYRKITKMINDKYKRLE